MNKTTVTKTTALTLLSLFAIFAAKAQAVSSIRVSNFIETPDFTELVTKVLQWLLSVAGGVAMLMIIIGGVFYIGSSGNEEKAQKGKKILTWAIGGLVVVLLSYSIIVEIENIFVN